MSNSEIGSVSDPALIKDCVPLDILYLQGHDASELLTTKVFNTLSSTQQQELLEACRVDPSDPNALMLARLQVNHQLVSMGRQLDRKNK